MSCPPRPAHRWRAGTRRFDGTPLGPNDYVISADEKTSIQARVRKHPTSAPHHGQPMRVEHEYARGGALAYLAAWDVGRAKVFGRCEPTTGIDPFMRLVNDVMTAEPYASADRVFWSSTSHRGAASVNRLRDAHTNAHLVHLPIHASWLNQVEIYFSVIQRKVLIPTTSPTSPRSRPDCWPFRTTTRRSPARSSGSSPPPTCTRCSPAAPTTTTNSSPRPPDRIRHRNSVLDH